MLSDIDYKTADLVIIPGGYPGYVNLRENKEVVDIVKYFLDNDKYIASICGGPTIFSYNNLANGTKYSYGKRNIINNWAIVKNKFAIAFLYRNLYSLQKLIKIV